MELAPSRLTPGDVVRVGAVGLASRRLRAGLSALGIAIGIAAMVAVLAISESSKADLLSALDRLGRISPVQTVSATSHVDALVYRSELIPDDETNGISALAVETSLALLVGAVAGLYPALRAARLVPTDALRSV